MSHMRDGWLGIASIKPPMVQRLLELLPPWGSHDLARSQFAAAFLLHLWQAAGINAPGPTPSFFVVRPDGCEDQVLDKVMCISNEWHGKHPPATTSFQRDLMIGVVHVRKLEKQGQEFMPYDSAKQWNDARSLLFGNHPFAPYHGRIDPDFLVVTPPDGRKTFTVSTPNDLKALHSDLKAGVNPFCPEGYDAFGNLEEKQATIAGSLTLSECPDELIAMSILGEKEVLFLPHAEVPEIDLPHHKEIISAYTWLIEDLRSTKFTQMRRRQNTLADPVERKYVEFIRTRLRYLPCNYEYFVHDTIRQLKSVALTLTLWIRQQGINEDRLVLLLSKYYRAALRGIAAGIAWLAWYGHGVCHPPHRKRLCKLLDLVRKKGTATRRALQRPLQRYMNAETRDKLLALMEHCGLIRLEGKKVIAVSYEEFLAGIPQLPGFP